MTKADAPPCSRNAWTRRALPVLLLVLLMMLAAWSAVAKPAATGMRVGDHGQMTRFVVDLSERVDFSIFTLSDPYRVVIDLPELEWGVDNQSALSGGGMIKGLRFGLFRPGNGRIVIDLSAPAQVRDSFLLPPQAGYGWRFVLDLSATGHEDFMASQGVPAARTRPPASAEDSAPSREEAAAPGIRAPTPLPQRKPGGGRKPVIVLDPGHGGVDPGAIGASGIYEKNITLAMARELRDMLEATGRYEVRLTRERDIFISLPDRVAKARSWNADMFISLHADALANPRVRGLSVYTLSEQASDAEAAALAERENKADLIAGMDLSSETPEVTSILIDLAQRESMNRSAHFAGKMIEELGNRVTLLRNTHRFAGFAVLKAPDVPSVLVELGYLSHPEEERLLRQASYRAKLGEAIVTSIDRYFQQPQRAWRP